jgi:pyruvate dehydrogenase E2 component (dihydrolipoamide acetyltransferase)
MPIAIAMPRLGMTMQEGTVLEWRVALGAAVERGQVVVAIESEKAEVELEAPAAGVLRHVYVGPGETVPSGTVLAALTATAAEPFDAEAFRQTAAPASGPLPLPAAPPAAASGGAPSAARSEGTSSAAAPITPAARRRATDLGLDLALVTGSGPGGRITREDVEAYAAALAARVRVAPGVALGVSRQGEGSPVLLLPGFGTDVSAFARQVPALAARYATLAVNPRGVGLSDAPPDERYDVATAAADAAAVAGGAAHVIGASLGAAVALELALAHPGAVRSLVLVTPFVRANPRLLAVVEAWCRLAAEHGRETLARALLPWLFPATYLGDDARRERAVRALVQTAARVPAPTLARWAAGARAWSGTRDGDLGRIAVPTLVLVAGEDLLVPEAAAVAAAIPGARLEVVAGAGHALGLEAPEIVNSAILRHLEGVDAR